MNKKAIIGLGILAVAGIGYYMWKNKKTSTSKVSGSKLTTPPSEMGASQDEEEDSNATGVIIKPKPSRCPKGYTFSNGRCVADAAYVAGWENGQEPKSGYTAGWEKDKETPMPCALGYEATLDPVKGTICTHPKKNIIRPFYAGVNM
jgi:hypothetical protein